MDAAFALCAQKSNFYLRFTLVWRFSLVSPVGWSSREAIPIPGSSFHICCASLRWKTHSHIYFLPFELNIPSPVVTSSFSRSRRQSGVFNFISRVPTCDGWLLQPVGNFGLKLPASARGRKKYLSNYKTSTSKCPFLSRKHVRH